MSTYLAHSPAEMLEERWETPRVMETAMISTSIETISQIQKASNEARWFSSKITDLSPFNKTLIVIERAKFSWAPKAISL